MNMQLGHPWRDIVVTNHPQPRHPWRGVRRVQSPFKATAQTPAHPHNLRGAVLKGDPPAKKVAA